MTCYKVTSSCFVSLCIITSLSSSMSWNTVMKNVSALNLIVRSLRAAHPVAPECYVKEEKVWTFRSCYLAECCPGVSEPGKGKYSLLDGASHLENWNWNWISQWRYTKKIKGFFFSFAHICVPKYLFLLPQIKMIIYFMILLIQGLSEGILNILGGCSIDYSE
jgi:hypothetical protein